MCIQSVFSGLLPQLAGGQTRHRHFRNHSRCVQGKQDDRGCLLTAISDIRQTKKTPREAGLSMVVLAVRQLVHLKRISIRRLCSARHRIQQPTAERVCARGVVRINGKQILRPEFYLSSRI